MNTLKEIATKTVQYEYERRVTVSHAYSLADVIGGKDAQIESELSQSIPLFRDAALNFITCYQSTPPYMPIREFHDAGLRMAHGTDQVHDLWGAHGNIDALEAMLVQSLKLESYSTNSGLRTLWKLITTEGAAVLGIEGYGIEPGTPADLVIHNAASPEWAILQNQDPRFVIKDGDVVATNDVEQGLSSV